MMTLQDAQAWVPGSQLVGDGSVALQRVHYRHPQPAGWRPLRRAARRAL